MLRSATIDPFAKVEIRPLYSDDREIVEKKVIIVHPEDGDPITAGFVSPEYKLVENRTA